MKLIPGWQRAYRLLSLHAALALLVLSLLQAELLPALQPFIPAQWFPLVAAGLAVLIGLLRIVAQPGVLDPPKGGPA